MLAQMRRPVIEASPQLLLSTIISTSKPGCRCLPGSSSTASKDSAHPRSHLPPQPNLHSRVRGALRASPPRVPSLAAFGRRPLVYVARLSLAGIRNPAQQRKCHPHSITSSARPSSAGGTSMPSAFAVLRLMISSTWVPCITGRSAGFSPFSTLPYLCRHLRLCCAMISCRKRQNDGQPSGRVHHPAFLTMPHLP